jgi:hypothetical protein
MQHAAEMLLKTILVQATQQTLGRGMDAR